MQSPAEAGDQPPAKKAKLSAVTFDGPPLAENDAVEEAPGELDCVFTDLAELQQELDQLDEDAAERVRQIDLEFALARRAVYVKRRKCTRDIPDFWSMCLQQHPYLMECMGGSDVEILAFLEEVVVDSCPGAETDPCSFTISMTLADNPYLYAQTVTKTFHHRVELELFQISVSGVNWKPGHEPSAETGDEERAPSFFEWFQGETVLETEYDAIAGAIMDQIWPDPVRWYLGDVPEELQEPGPGEGADDFDTKMQYPSRSSDNAGPRLASHKWVTRKGAEAPDDESPYAEGLEGDDDVDDAEGDDEDDVGGDGGDDDEGDDDEDDGEDEYGDEDGDAGEGAA